MSWFGWLTKGNLTLSLLDSLMACVEIIAVVLVVSFIHDVWWWIRRKVRRRFPAHEPLNPHSHEGDLT